MAFRIPLSRLAAMVSESIEAYFEDASFWIVAEITDVKKYADKNWCFLKFIEKNKGQVVTEMAGVVWPKAYQSLIKFEHLTGKQFSSGLEIACLVQVKFNSKFGLKLEVQEIDTAFTLGKIEVERQETLDRLLRNYPHHISLLNNDYITFNKKLELPVAIKNIALIAAEGSDGERDFLHELANNAFGYSFNVTRYHASVQGQQAVPEICKHLDVIHTIAPSYDIIALVRGGGSSTDLSAFDDYEVARRLAVFPIPALTGIGHDRNVSVADLMVRNHKTPTRVAAAIAEHNLLFESRLNDISDRITANVNNRLIFLRQGLERYEHHLIHAVPHRLQRHRLQIMQMQSMMQQVMKHQLANYHHQLIRTKARIDERSVAKLHKAQLQLSHLNHWIDEVSPERILKRGYVILRKNNKIIERAGETLQEGDELTAQLQDATLGLTIKKIDHGTT